MNRNIVFWSGILGVTLFAVASILGGFQFEDYSPISQFISETMAVGTPHGESLRYFGYIPSGILLTLFSFSMLKFMPPTSLVTLGFWGLAIFYGIATVMVGFFPCDAGCNKDLIDPSASQLIHNLTGLLTYVFVPLSILLVGIGVRRFKDYDRLSKIAISCTLVSILFIGVMLKDPMSEYIGLYQRIIEGTFIVWIIACSFFVKNNKTEA